MNNEGMSRSVQAPSLLRRVGLSFLLGFSLFVLGALLQGLFHQRGITGISIYMDDLVLGVLAGLVVFAYEQRRSRDMRQKVAVIAAMNHHVRNALQAISYVPYAEQAKQIQVIQQSVNRIQWALQEILPGGSAEEQKLPHTTAGETKKQEDDKPAGTSTNA
jgi:signal transduction histidine kinase